MLNGFNVDIIGFSLLKNLSIQVFIAFEFQFHKKTDFYRFPGFSGLYFVLTEISSLENLFVHVFIVSEFQFNRKTDISRFSGYLSVSILVPSDSDYSKTY